jgi:hypothetical protein
MSNNIGRTITDFYCNGFFGRDYDLADAVIIAEGDEYVVIRKENGIIMFGSFQSWEYNRNEDGSLAYGIYNLTSLDASLKQKMIDEWCGDDWGIFQKNNYLI